MLRLMCNEKYIKYSVNITERTKEKHAIWVFLLNISIYIYLNVVLTVVTHCGIIMYLKWKIKSNVLMKRDKTCLRLRKSCKTDELCELYITNNLM